jgi:hypothetical protein
MSVHGRNPNRQPHGLHAIAVPDGMRRGQI